MILAVAIILSITPSFAEKSTELEIWIVDSDDANESKYLFEIVGDELGIQ